MSLRNEGITKPILILGYTPVDTVKILAEKEITQAKLHFRKFRIIVQIRVRNRMVRENACNFDIRHFAYCNDIL